MTKKLTLKDLKKAPLGFKFHHKSEGVFYKSGYNLCIPIDEHPFHIDCNSWTKANTLYSTSILVEVFDELSGDLYEG